jgi:hypothetical protein
VAGRVVGRIRLHLDHDAADAVQEERRADQRGRDLVDVAREEVRRDG